MRSKPTTSLVLLSVFLWVPYVGAESKKKQADRELAEELTASLVLVSSQLQTFADVRDQLAKARLRTTQNLEDNLIWLQEGNDFDTRVWKVIGEEGRVDLLEGVLDATENIAARRKAAVEREAQKAQRLSKARSAVNRRATELGAAASSLASLAEPPTSGAAVAALVSRTMRQLAANLGEESSKLKDGLEVATQLAEVVEARLQSPVAEN